MKKIAVFVEGQTELIFVREMILKMFDYSNVSLECFSLRKNNSLIPVDYNFSSPNAQFYFQLLDVGNDVAVLSRIKRLEESLHKSNFTLIIALRDIYSKQYRKVSNEINTAINLKFISETENQISEFQKTEINISFHFAIMEIETWFLALYNSIIKIDSNITIAKINEKLDLDIVNIDPEITFYHPTNEMDKIYSIIEKSYGKKKSEIESIVDKIEKQDFIDLYSSEKCNSFKPFFEAFQFPP